MFVHNFKQCTLGYYLVFELGNIHYVDSSCNSEIYLCMSNSIEALMDKVDPSRPLLPLLPGIDGP